MDQIARAPVGFGTLGHPNIKSWGFKSLGEQALPGSGFGTMDVEFQSGALYRYYEVPMATFIALTHSSTPGKDFDLLVKKPGYKYEKLKDGVPALKKQKKVVTLDDV